MFEHVYGPTDYFVVFLQYYPLIWWSILHSMFNWWLDALATKRDGMLSSTVVRSYVFQGSFFLPFIVW